MNRDSTILEFDHVSFTYKPPDGPWVLHSVTISVARGECVVILGPNGTGKTTLCNIAFGLLVPTQGTVRRNGGDAETLSRDAALVFQGESLFPWMKAIHQVAFALECADIPRRQCLDKARDALREMGVEGAAELYPHQLSGGMRKRVVLARAFVRNPHIILMDEPFSELDAPTREQIQEQVCALRQNHGITLLAVSHDPDEAAFLATRVILLQPHGGTVAAVLESPLGDKTRTPELRMTSEFLDFRTELWKRLHALNNAAKQSKAVKQ